LSCYSNKLNQLVYENVHVITDLSTKRSVFKRYHSDKHFSEFSTYTMAAKNQLRNKITSLSPGRLSFRVPVQYPARSSGRSERQTAAWSLRAVQRPVYDVRRLIKNGLRRPASVCLSVCPSVCGDENSVTTHQGRRECRIFARRLDICHPYLLNQSNSNSHAIYKSLFAQKR